MGDAFRVNFYRTSTKCNETNQENGTLNALSEVEKKVVELIIENQGITQDKIAEIAKVSKSRIRYAMKSLKERGILVREGSAKSGKWLIKK